MKSPLLRRFNLEVDQFANFVGLNSVFLIKLGATIRLSRILLPRLRFFTFSASLRVCTFRRTLREIRMIRDKGIISRISNEAISLLRFLKLMSRYLRMFVALFPWLEKR